MSDKKPIMSDIDLFLREFDKSHPQKTASERDESEKHRKLFEKRDTPIAQEDNLL